MTYTIDDVNPGDVVTLERGEEGRPGFSRRIAIANNGYTADSSRASMSEIREMIEYADYRIVGMQRVRPQGSLMLVDEPDDGVGVAISKGHNQGGTCWSFGAGDWFDLQNPEEALPVPAAPLRELLDAWDDMSDHQQRVWEETSAPAPRVVVRNKVAAFIESTRAEWERAGITP